MEELISKHEIHYAIIIDRWPEVFMISTGKPAAGSQLRSGRIFLAQTN